MIAVVAGRLMNAAAWNKIPLVVSCALVPTERISAIIKARENVGGTWNKNKRRGDESSEGGTLSEHSSSQLKHRVEQIATHEEEMGRNMEKCMAQQQQLAQLVEGLRTQLSQLQINLVPDVTGGSQLQGLSPMPNHQFRIQTDLDLGKFSGSDPVPTNELTFEQWLSDIRVYQRQFPEFVLLPVVRKSIQGRAKSVLRNLEPDYTIDQAIEVLTREYEGVANSDVVFKEFYQLKQEKNGKGPGFPTNELTFEQWLSDIRVYQRQFPEFVLLPVVRKSIQGRAKSVLRNLEPDYTIDQAIEVLTREYEGVANSDVVFKEFYQLKQEKNEKVQVFSVRLREALNKLTLRFPGRVPAGDDRILCDRFFYGMKAELKSCVRHLFDFS